MHGRLAVACTVAPSAQPAVQHRGVDLLWKEKTVGVAVSPHAVTSHAKMSGAAATSCQQPACDE